MSEYSIALEKQVFCQRMMADGVTEPFELFHRIVETAEPYYVSSEMSKLINHGFDELGRTGMDVTLTHDMSPTPAGFIWLETPIAFDESHHPSHCIGWYINGQIQETMEYALGIAIPHMTATNQDGAGVDEGHAHVMDCLWRWETSLRDEQERSPESKMNAARTWMAAFFLFVNQRILVRQRIAPDRATRRRLRMRPEDAPLINVIALRKTRHNKHERIGDDERDWSCQWMVRGHWRQQWYPKLKLHQPKWITPYIKGPEDKPLKQPRATVFAVVR